MQTRIIEEEVSKGVEASKQAEDGDGRLMLISAPQLQQYMHTSKATYGGYRKGWFTPLTVIIMSTVHGAWVRSGSLACHLSSRKKNVTLLRTVLFMSSVL